KLHVQTRQVKSITISSDDEEEEEISNSIQKLKIQNSDEKITPMRTKKIIDSSDDEKPNITSFVKRKTIEDSFSDEDVLIKPKPRLSKKVIEEANIAEFKAPIPRKKKIESDEEVLQPESESEEEKPRQKTQRRSKTIYVDVGSSEEEEKPQKTSPTRKNKMSDSDSEDEKPRKR